MVNPGAARREIAIDVLVAGGGPAGLSAAIAVAERGLRVLVVDSPAGRRTERSEMLSSLAAPIMDRLGVMAVTRRAIPLGHMKSQWGAQSHQGTIKRSRAISGWSVERHAVRAALRERVARIGTQFRELRVDSVTGGLKEWRVQARGDDPRTVTDIACHYIIDATGRSASVARRVGARLEVGADLVAMLFDVIVPVPLLLLAEAVPDGWWYSLPNARAGGTVGYLTSAGVARHLARNPTEILRKQAANLRLVPCPGSLAPTLHDSRSLRLTRCAGPGWLAAGDAAAAFDPIASQGLFNALSTGFFAGNAAADALGGDPSAPEIYEELVARTASRTHALTSGQYAASGLTTAFWANRSRHGFSPRGADHNVSTARQPG